MSSSVFFSLSISFCLSLLLLNFHRFSCIFQVQIFLSSILFSSSDNSSLPFSPSILRDLLRGPNWIFLHYLHTGFCRVKALRLTSRLENLPNRQGTCQVDADVLGSDPC